MLVIFTFLLVICSLSARAADRALSFWRVSYWARFLRYSLLIRGAGDLLVNSVYARGELSHLSDQSAQVMLERSSLSQALRMPWFVFIIMN